MESITVTTPEYLSSDILEEAFMQSFLVIYRIQYALGSCRLDARNRFVTPPTTAQKCYTLLCVLMTAASNYALGHFYILKVKHKAIRYLCLTSILLQFTSFALNVINVRFINSDKNVEFYVNMQKIDRLLKIDRWTVLNEWVSKITNTPVVFTLIIFVTLMITACVEQGLTCLIFIGPAYSILALVLELTVCSSIIAYFLLRIRFINILMENHLTRKVHPKTEKSFISRKYLLYYVQTTQHYYETSETNIFLRELFKCFTMYQDLYRFQLLIFCLQSVANSLVAFELLLYSIQNSETTLFETATYVIFTIFDVIAAVLLGFRYELFFNEVRETKRLCINVMARHHEGPLRERARKMLRIIDETPPRFSIYEMWDINAATFVAMFSLITSLVVTLLQFAFL